MTAAVLTRDRSLSRKVWDTCCGYVRMDVVEERNFPLTGILRYLSLLFPVLMYFFQSSFLHLSNDQFAFMLIGTSLTLGLQDALAGLTARLQFAQERGTLETYLIEPVPWALIPIAMNIWRSLIGASLTCLMIGFGWVLGAPIKASAIPLALVVLMLGVAACNAIGAFAASFLVLFKRGEPVISFYGLAAGVLGGALFPTSVLPSWIRWMSYLVPHSYVINTERQLLMTDPPNTGLAPGLSILLLTAFCVIAFAIGLSLFDRSLRTARRLGVLGV